MKNITNVFYEFLIALCCLMSSSCTLGMGRYVDASTAC